MAHVIGDSLATQAGFEPLETPFDISLAPPAFELGIADAPGQEIALASALRGADTIQDHGERFSDEVLKELPLRWLHTWYDQGHAPSAISALSGRKTITYTQGGYTVEPDDGNMFWTVDETYIDLLICVGRGLGLGPLLPNLRVLHTYEFRLDLQKPGRQFTAKYAKLGFDPTNAMLWIGRSSASEDVWLAFAPKIFVQGGEYNDETPAHWRGTRSTTLSLSHYRCVVMFLARMMYNIGFLDIILDVDYPSVTEEFEYKSATNMQ